MKQENDSTARNGLESVMSNIRLSLKQTIKEPVNKIFIEQNSPEPKANN